jgi:hypothetical protein
MQVVFENWFVTMSYDPEKSLLLDTWSVNSDKLTGAEFEEILSAWVELIKKYNIKYGLTDTIRMHYAVPIELQEFAGNKMAEALEAGFVKHAMILPDTNLFAKVGVEMSVEEVNGEVESLVTNYFNTKEEAMKWLGLL